MAKQSAQAKATNAQEATKLELRLIAAYKAVDGSQVELASLAIESRSVYKTEENAREGFTRVVCEARGDITPAQHAMPKKDKTPEQIAAGCVVMSRVSELMAIYRAGVLPENAAGMQLNKLAREVRQLNPKAAPASGTTARTTKGPKEESAPVAVELSALQHLDVALQMLKKDVTDPAALEIVADLVDIAAELAEALAPKARVSRRARK